MTTTSYPAKGTGGFDIADWAEYFDALDGIVNDYAGTALTLTRINTGEIARYSVGKVRVGGYVLEVTADHDLVVSTSAATYYTWACYDPALNVAGGGGAASAAGPCTLGISSGLPSTTGSKQYVILDRIVRAASQSLTAASVTSYRRWIGSASEWPISRALESVESDYPRGSVRYDRDLNRVMVRTMNAAGSAMEWREIGGVAAVAFPASANLIAQTGQGPAEYYVTPGNIVNLQGTLKRNTGKLGTGSTVTLGTLPAGHRPPFERGYIVRSSGNTNGLARIVVLASGAVNLLSGLTATEIDWLTLDGVSFKAQ